MIKLVVKLIFIVLFFVLSSCSPMNKDSYMQEYKEFIAEVKQSSATYTQEDWEKATIRFEKFTGTWYDDFSDELSIRDNLLISKYSVEFGIVKLKNESIDFINLFNKEDYEEVKAKMQYYVDNDMQKDIEYVQQQAKEVGETAVKSLEEIIKELEKKQ